MQRGGQRAFPGNPLILLVSDITIVFVLFVSKIHISCFESIVLEYLETWEVCCCGQVQLMDQQPCCRQPCESSPRHISLESLNSKGATPMRRTGSFLIHAWVTCVLTNANYSGGYTCSPTTSTCFRGVIYSMYDPTLLLRRLPGDVQCLIGGTRCLQAFSGDLVAFRCQKLTCICFRRHPRLPRLQLQVAVGVKCL
jgi:hypothetical protein